MSSFKALQVSETEGGRFESKVVERTTEELPAGEVLIRVRYSSLNFKDALSASGNRGVTGPIRILRGSMPPVSWPRPAWPSSPKAMK